MKTLIRSLLLLTLLCTSALYAQDLRRKAMLGVQFQPAADSVRMARGYKGAACLQVDGVIPGSTAEKLGILPGDLLLQANGKTLAVTQDLIQVAMQLRSGDPVTLEIWRKKKQVTLSGPAVPKPLEVYENAVVDYGIVPFQGGKLRLIGTHPQGSGPFPVVYFIPGYNCISVDNLQGWHPYRKLIEGLNAAGYATVRVEKPQMGDSEGGPNCFACDFRTEVAAFQEGYNAMLALPYVKRDQVFIFGHSLGGIEAPLLTQGTAPRGIMVYGTTADPWVEYLTKMLRFQNAMNTELGWEQVEADMREYHHLLYAQYVQQKSPAEVARIQAGWAKLLERDFQWDGAEMLFERHYQYWYQIAQANLVQAWSQTPAHVLSLYGESDFQVFEQVAMERIAQIVNARHPGHGTFRSFPETDHMMARVGSFEDGLALMNAPGYAQELGKRFNAEIVRTMTDWMRGVLAGK